MENIIRHQNLRSHCWKNINNKMKNLFICFLLFLSTAIYSAEIDELYSLYYKLKMDDLAVQIKDEGLSDNPDLRFFQALFIDDAEQAFQIYQKLFNQSEGRLKYVSGAKLFEFYYAKGFYISASKFEEYKTNLNLYAEQISETVAEKELQITSNYVIQFGAFSSRSNAENLSRQLLEKGLNTIIKKREVNNIPLYCVWMDGKKNFSQTLKYAEILKNKHKFKYRIIEP